MLRSIKPLYGDKLGASDCEIGHVKDFHFDDRHFCDSMVDVQRWTIRQLVIKTGHRFSGKEVQIPTGTVDRISYEESTVFVNLTREAVEQSPVHHLAPVGEAA